MIDKAEAKERASRAISTDFVLLDEQTQEEPFGWVFFYDSARHIETRDPSDSLAGNAPLVVFRDTGEVRRTGTAHPLEHYLAPLREEWNERHC